MTNGSSTIQNVINANVPAGGPVYLEYRVVAGPALLLGTTLVAGPITLRGTSASCGGGGGGTSAVIAEFRIPLDEFKQQVVPIAGQIAKIAGARVVGIAGGPAKCRVVVEDFGFDACIDYKNENVAAALKAHCPKGVDVYYDNVGGDILNAVLGRLAPKARVVLCGVISSYLTGEHPGPSNYVNLLARTASMQGFNALEMWDRFDEAFADLRRWGQEGKLVHRETVLTGLESCVDALNGLFTGANIGKMLVKISEPTPR